MKRLLKLQLSLSQKQSDKGKDLQKEEVLLIHKDHAFCVAKPHHREELLDLIAFSSVRDMPTITSFYHDDKDYIKHTEKYERNTTKKELTV